MKMKVLCGAAIAALTLMSGVVIAQSIQPGYALITRSSVGSSTEYSASLVMRASYNNDIKYFSYNETNKIGDMSNSPVEYTLNWVNGNSNEFSIYTGSTYLDIDTSANKFINSDTPVYWSMDENGIGRTIENTTKYLYYNNTSPRCAPYKLSSITAAYAPIFFYTEEQLTSWKGRCSGSFAEACLTTLISGNFIPSEGETPTPTEGIIILPRDGTAIESSNFSIEKDGITVAVTASTLTADQIRVFKNQTITISSDTSISKIEFTCTANGTAKYGPGCFAAQNGYTFEAAGKKGTWKGTSQSVSFTASTNQVRITQIVVTLSA